MALWVLLAVLTGAAVVAVLMPLGRPAAPGRSRADADLAVYRDQLEEIEKDLERGAMAPEEAEAARAEVGRRLLAAGGDMAAADAASARLTPRAVSWTVVIAIPMVSLALYLALGSPNLPGQPLAARLSAPPENQDVATLIGRVEAHLAENPEDGRGWEVLAPVYMRLGRAQDAAQAWRNAIRLSGSTAERQSGLGEALVSMEDGIVTDEARGAFEAVLASEPEAVTPRFFLALAAEQDGEWGEAARRWRDLLAGAAEDAPWRQVAADRLAAAERAGGAAPPGPTASDMQAAAGMTEEERSGLIAGMVERLAARLEADGNDLDGWLRLARAYAVIGQTEQARAALISARENFTDDAAADRAISAAAEELGLGS